MKSTIPNLIFVIAIGIFTIWLTFLTTKGSLTDNSFKGFFRKLTNRGKLTALVLISIFALLIGQEINNSNISHNKDLLLSQERDARDAKITNGIKNGVDSVISIYSKEQNLKFDTLSRQVSEVKISPRELPENSNENPVILVHKDGISIRSSLPTLQSYNLTITCRDAGATNFNVKASILNEYAGQKYSKSEINFFPDGFRTFKNSSFNTGFKSLGAYIPTKLYIYLKGSYYSLDRSKSYEIDDLYFFNNKTGETTFKTGSERTLIIGIINKLPNDGTIIKID